MPKAKARLKVRVEIEENKFLAALILHLERRRTSYDHHY